MYLPFDSSRDFGKIKASQRKSHCFHYRSSRLFFHHHHSWKKSIHRKQTNWLNTPNRPIFSAVNRAIRRTGYTIFQLSISFLRSPFHLFFPPSSCSFRKARRKSERCLLLTQRHLFSIAFGRFFFTLSFIGYFFETSLRVYFSSALRYYFVYAPKENIGRYARILDKELALCHDFTISSKIHGSYTADRPFTRSSINPAGVARGSRIWSGSRYSAWRFIVGRLPSTRRRVLWTPYRSDRQSGSFMY